MRSQLPRIGCRETKTRPYPSSLPANPEGLCSPQFLCQSQHICTATNIGREQFVVVQSHAARPLDILSSSVEPRSRETTTERIFRPVIGVARHHLVGQSGPQHATNDLDPDLTGKIAVGLSRTEPQYSFRS